MVQNMEFFHAKVCGKVNALLGFFPMIHELEYFGQWIKLQIFIIDKKNLHVRLKKENIICLKKHYIK
jgi:hypothetical protein